MTPALCLPSAIRRLRRTVALCLVIAALAAAVAIRLGPQHGAWADTSAGPPADTLLGEGGSFSQPVINSLLNADSQGLLPLIGAYFQANIDQGRSDFASGAADYAITELPMTTADQATATTNNRPFAYVPLFALPVAIDALIECDPTQTLQPDTFCSGLQLTIPLLEQLITGNISSWVDPQLNQIQNGNPLVPANANINPRYQVDPSAVTAILSNAFETNPTSKSSWDAWLTNQKVPAGTDPVETWLTGLQGGDLAVTNALVPLNEQTNQPQNPPDWGIGDIAPLPADWIGPPRNIPTVAMQNAAGAYVSPTVAATTAALNDATIDPTTNLVTFNNSATDTAAYPLCAVAYMVVPLSGLSSAKAAGLAGLIRYILGTKAQSSLSALGAAPLPSSLLTAGLDEATKVANEPTSTPTTTTTTSTTTATGSGSLSSFTSSSSGGGGGTSGGSLAFTGSNALPVAAAGVLLVCVGAVARRRFRRALPTASQQPTA